MTATASGLLSDLESRGVTATVTPEGNLYCEPRAALDEETIKRIRLHKQELLTILAPPPRFVRKEQERATALGLVARWSREFGYVSLHDPTTGEWFDLPTKDAPGWAVREASKRKELKKHHGIHRTLTASEMEEVWEAERAPEPEGIVEDYPIEEEEE